ncbi:MAG: GH25 family lysozyme [Actinomycetes bacterium]
MSWTASSGSRMRTRLLSFGLSVAFLTTGVATINVVTAQADTVITGVDVSKWDHSATTAYPAGTPIDWVKVKAAGRSFAIIKASGRTQDLTNYRNPYFANDYKQARAAGLVVGAYHYARPALPLSTATDQARYFISTVQKVGSFRDQKTFPAVLDLETTGGLGKADLIAWTQQFLDTAQALTGRKPILYSYDYFIRSTLGNTKQFSSYPLWYARYTTTVPTSSTIPGGWSQWTMWQYSSTTTTDGIIGAGDVNRFNGTATALLAFADGRKSGYGPPSIPLTPVATPGTGSAQLSWIIPNDDGGVPVNRYRVSVDAGVEAITPGTSFLAVGLEPGTHTYSISAENLAGVGLPATGSFTVAPYDVSTLPAPVVPTVVLNTPAASIGSAYNMVQIKVSRADTLQAIGNAEVTVAITPELGAPRTPRTVYTDAEGIVSVTFRSQVDTAVTVTTTGGAWYSAVTKQTAVRIAPTLTASLSASVVRRKGVVRLAGSTSPLLAGERVYRQLFTGGRWVTKATRVVGATGTYSFTVTTTTTGRKVQRVLLPSNSHHLRVVSRTRTLIIR